MSYDNSSWNVNSLPKDSIPKMQENFRALKDDKIVNAGKLQDKTLTEIMTDVSNAGQVAINELDAKKAPKDNAKFTGLVEIGGNIKLYNETNNNTVGNPADESVFSIHAGSSSGYTSKVALTGGYGNAGNIDFVTKSVNRMTITSDGNVGIGTINPQATLHSTGSTILGGASSVVWSQLGNSQLTLCIDGNTLIFNWKNTAGETHSATLTGS